VFGFVISASHELKKKTTAEEMEGRKVRGKREGTERRGVELKESRYKISRSIEIFGRSPHC
jgi:hypothetical protein